MHAPRIPNPRCFRYLNGCILDKLISRASAVLAQVQKTAKAKARLTSLPEESELLRDLLLPTAWKYLSKTSMDISFFQPEA